MSRPTLERPPVPLRLRVKRAFRIATLVVPSWLAWLVATTSEHTDGVASAMARALLPLWVLLAFAAALRFASQLVWRRDRKEGLFASIDVLTGAGSALAWTSALGIMGAVWLGWASLAYVGLLGTGIFHIVVILAIAAFRTGDPRVGPFGSVGSITRRFTPFMPTEGEDVVEEVHLENVHIPIGFRLFVTGRVGRRWATTRHVLDTTASGGEVSLEAQIGPAVRGDVDAEPIRIWLEDTFGLTRSNPIEVARARLTVLPRSIVARHATPLFDRGIGSSEAVPTAMLPTEGAFDLREYAPGDDVRRIHWVRSLAARELVVRLPDELPPDRPRIRLVLDTFFPDHDLACDAPSELLDALVDTWLAVGRALLASGARVTLVAPLSELEGVARQDLSYRNEVEALRLGARITWQSTTRVEEILTDERTFIVSRSVLFTPPENTKARWIVVLPSLSEPSWPIGDDVWMPYPMGSPDNRRSRIRAEKEACTRARADHAQVLAAMRTIVARPPAGSFLVRPSGPGDVVLEALR
ncbi:MAG: DUF58 domain-containing protein [Deltaproteobacteria bacterium]|nr:DUF58 domain-containing protein [Deltaproteobacteria bacterium]